LAKLTLEILADHQALAPVLLEVKEHCSFADYFIICSGASKRQVMALAQHLEEDLAKDKVKPLGMEGVQEGLWVLMDYNTVVVHIFYQELREFYDLEGLWADTLKAEMTSPRQGAKSSADPAPEPAPPPVRSQSPDHE
jgi:ribosome-associated protein